MSNPERHPTEVVCSENPPPPHAVAPRRSDQPAVLLPYREVPLGGPRAMPVRRSLPQRERSLIGAWCFVDHYGPDDVSRTGGMVVPGHPHTGLQTVSWLFSGEVEHRDTTGVHAFVRPGELNIMTAGSGIAHSEYSTPTTTVLHGAQLWVALPDAHRDTSPGFEHYAPPVTRYGGARVLVFLGTLFGQTSPVTMFSDLVGAEVTLEAGASLAFDVDPAHEHGLLCDAGRLTVDDVTAEPGEIAFAATGAEQLRVTAGADEPARFLVLGGAPFGEQIVMWWNFIGRSHDEVVGFREDWQREREQAQQGEARAAVSRFGAFPEAWEHTLPAPGLPNLRLRSRG
ncbi:pirin family protein [Terrabacter aeriphilus]|uniref:Pirin family protein n=1 Tax=Terrabacter aeriphilus TaxID=515662 RepID=A0ABP9JLG1_9MICO